MSNPLNSSTTTLSDALKTGVSLEAGLRALAVEIDSYSLKRSINRLVTELEKGKPLADVLQQMRFPKFFSALLQAGLKAGHPVEAIIEYQNYVTEQRLARNLIFSQLARIVVMLLICLFILGISYLFIIPMFHNILIDTYDLSFGSGISGDLVTGSFLISELVNAIHHSMEKVIPGGLISFILLMVAGLVTAIAMIGPYTILGFLPWAGVIVRDHQLAKISRLMSLQLAYNQPLPDAIQLTRNQIHDLSIKQILSRIQKQAHFEHELQIVDREVPEGFAKIFLSKGTGQVMSDRFRQWGNILSNQSQNSLRWLVGILEPLLYFTTLFLFAKTMFIFIVPLMQMLNQLS